MHRRRHFCLHERFGVFPVYTTGYVNNNNNNKEGEKKKKAPLLTRFEFLRGITRQAQYEAGEQNGNS